MWWQQWKSLALGMSLSGSLNSGQTGKFPEQSSVSVHFICLWLHIFVKCYPSLFCHFDQIIRCLSLSDCFCTGIIQIIPTWYLWAKPLRSSNYSHLGISEDLVQPFNTVWEYYCPEQFFPLCSVSSWVCEYGAEGDVGREKKKQDEESSTPQ